MGMDMDLVAACVTLHLHFEHSAKYMFVKDNFLIPQKQLQNSKLITD